MSNWYDSPANVLDLARWMLTDEWKPSLERPKETLVGEMIAQPSVWDGAWLNYQVSLKPKEPTLSEWAEKMYGPGLHMEMAQRIEALEAKEREL